MDHLLILAAALLVDRFVGDPDWLWRRLPHPVVLFGHAIAFFDRAWNREADGAARRRSRGTAAIAVLLVTSVLAAAAIGVLLDRLGSIGLLIEVVLVSILLAQRSLAEHVGAVATAMRTEGLSGARRAVSRIVGRDPENLDAPAIHRAALESLAENFSDGVVAPALWFGVFGLPGLFAYKMLNTADSMIGHRNDRYRAFGWATARLDDLANWPASRISALLIAGAAYASKGRRAAIRALECALRDASLHRSPNAGWPEAALAGAQDISLAGERRYGGVLTREPRLNGAGRYQLQGRDVDDGLGLFWRACSLLTLAVLAAYILLATFS